MYKQLSEQSMRGKCKICNGLQTHKITVKQTGQGLYNFFDYNYCHDCFSLSINQVPENIADYYLNYYAYATFTDERKFSIKSFFRKLTFKNPFLFYFKKKFGNYIYDFNLTSTLSLNLSKTSKILDVGSGSGKFVFDLHELGYKNSFGIDYYLDEDKSYSNGSKIKKTDLFSLEETYDLITFHHSLEHMEDLNAVFEKVHSLLNLKGVCVVRIPNISSYAYKTFRQYWTGIHAPYHFCLPSIKAMQDLAIKNKLSILSIKGEQTLGFFLSNIENELDLVNPDTMFMKFKKLHTKLDFDYWRKKKKLIKQSPELCEWVVYYMTKLS